MAHMAFGIKDAFDDRDGIKTFVQPDALDPSNPPENAVDDRPRHVWMNRTGMFSPCGVSGDSFYVYLDVIEGAGSEVSLTLGTFANLKDAPTFAAIVASRLNATPGLSLTYSVSHDPTAGTFSISSSGTFSILWKTGTHGLDNWASATAYRNASKWLGFSPTGDDTGATSYTGDSVRWDTELAIKLERADLTTKTTANVFAAVLQSAAHEGGADVDFSDFKIYGANSDLGMSRAQWEAGAAVTLTFSERPTDPDERAPTNKIQIAFDPSNVAMSYIYWFVSWRYFDETKGHAMGLLKALQIVKSSTRQIASLQGHGLVDPSTTLGVDSYWPVRNQLRWVAPLSFDAWGATDFRDVVQETVKRTRARGLLWALNWDQIYAGTSGYEAQNEAAKGFLFWGAIRDYSDDDYEGAGSNDFISAEMTVEQVR